MSTNVRVLTRNLSNGEVTDERHIDHNKADDREWLGKHSFWAMRNNHSVTALPEIS